jgi:hypothetical protein
VTGAGVVVAVGAVVGEEARVAVTPKIDVELALGEVVRSGSLGPAARAVCVAMVLKIDSRGSSVGVATDAEVAERVQAAINKAARSKKRI